MKSITEIAGAFFLAAMLTSSFADAKGSGGKGRSSASHSSDYSSSHSTHAAGQTKAAGVPRDSHGRIARSATAKHDFQKTNPCPSTGRSNGACPGYVIDHVVPLKRGGADDPSNMQWQTVEAAKAKDKVE